MPQLEGPEQAVLVSLLVGHIGSIEQLDHAMNHSGNGHVSDYAANVALPLAVSSVIDAFSRQYKILELVNGVLNDANGLKGNCPPLIQWLNETTPALEERRSKRCETARTSNGSPQYAWRDVLPSEAVLLFPSVPNVREPAPLELLRRIAAQISSKESHQLVNEANRIRMELDPGDELRKVVSWGKLPDPSSGMEYFLGSVFDEARRKSPRTYAAFLLIFGNECSADLQSKCDSVLQKLVNYT